jgi:putative hydrolase of the HAD superfamily
MPRHFLWHTHQFDNLASLLVFEPQLATMLRRLPGRKIVFSNAPRHYALQVLRLMGVTGHFDAVSAIEDSGYAPKPAIEGFRRLLRTEKLDARRCVMVEDNLANLCTAKRLGMTTVWVSREVRRPAYVDFRLRSVVELPKVMRSLARR